jgi:hypothetical protein
MTTNPEMLNALRLQARACERFGSPFNGAFVDRIADDYAADGPVAGLLAPWDGADLKTIFDEAAPIRIANTFNHLAMGGEAPALSAAWPRMGFEADPDAAWTAARAAIGAHREMLEAFLTHEPQTNEVGRTAVLLGGFLQVAAETGLPLRVFEVGASAGLNQFWDRLRYDMGPVTWGDPSSPVRIGAEWTGGPPRLDAKVDVIERGACDRRPSDLSDPVQRRRLLACIWPDQFERQARSRAAIDLALASGVQVEAADALQWTRARVAPKAGTATVLYHSVFWQYLPGETQAGLAAAIQDLGAAATAEAPFAWLRMEPSTQNLALFELRLTLWPSGAERLLAEAHTHGAWVRWLGVP